MIKDYKSFQAQAYLRFTNGSLTYQDVYLHDKETLFGSDPACQICLSDPSILPRHARFIWHKGVLYIQNYRQSAVTVNGQKVSGILPLLNGDKVVLGTISIKVHLEQNSVPQQDFPSIAQKGDTDDRDSQSQSSFTVKQSFDQVPVLPIELPTATQHRAMPSTFHHDMAATAPLIQKSMSSSDTTSTEITRRLCVAVHLDDQFRMHVFQNIVNEERKVLGKAYGIDIIPVVKCCLAAQKRTFVRDLILFAITMVAPLFISSTISAFYTSLRRLFAVPPGNIISSHGYSFMVSFLIFISPVMNSPFLMPALTFVFLNFIGAVATMRQPFVPSKQLATLYLVVLLLLFRNTLLLPLYILGWLAVTLDKLLAYFGPIAKDLQKDKFNPAALSQQIDPALEQKLREKFNTQEGNVVAYSGDWPFVGAGHRIGGWSFVIDATRRREAEGGSLFTSPPFQVKEMYAFIAQKMENLNLPGLDEISCKDELYLQGQKIRNDQRFLANPLASPYTQVPSALIEEFMEKPTQDIHYYQCIRLTLYQGEVILSIFLKLVLSGKNLFIGADYLLLPPLKEEFRQADILASRPALQKVQTLVQESFFETLPLLASALPRVMPLIIGALPRVLSWALRKPEVVMRRGGMRPSIRNHPDFDYGAVGSLRQFISSPNYRPFQNLNHEMYLKIAERHLLESMVEFLATKQIDTTDVEKRMAVILNDDVRRAKGRSQLLNALEPPL